MGLFSAVIDRSPIDKFGASGNAASLANHSATSVARSQELWNMNSARNQMMQDQQMQQAFDIQPQQGMMAQRQAARSGQAFSPAGMDSSSAIRSQVQKGFANRMMAQQAQSGTFMGQAASMQGQAASIKNNLNQLYRQQQAANQQARQQAKAAKLSLASGIMGAVAGPALGALGGGIAGMIGGGGFKAGASGAAGLQPLAQSSGGGGGNAMFSQAIMNQSNQGNQGFNFNPSSWLG